MDIYDPKDIEPRWRQFWLNKQVYQPDLVAAKKPYYNLMMFPYPSAEGLHVGNMYAFTGADVHGRFKRMQGFDVFQPIGLDGFGIHSENYAIKVGRHPKDHAKISEKHFYEQLHMIGDGFAWDQKLETYDPEYYRWTQWLFVQMYKHGLAYRKKAMVNWCPSCKTVLSDEQVEGGVCERCKTETIRKETEQWFFKITAYADQLLNNIPKLNWPKKITSAQQNWIGKTKGLNISFQIDGSNEQIVVWTKFWETVFGVTFLVVAPEHPVVALLLNSKVKIQNSKLKEAHEYVEKALKKTDQKRKADEKNKTGVFAGIYAVNPVNGQKIPVWIADYVLTDVGTGAVMGVPSHDARDFDFAKKHSLEVKQVVSYPDQEIDVKVKNGLMAYEGEGILVNSGEFDGMDAWGAGKKRMADWLIDNKFAEWKTTYHLRDWLISRQRYWGPPIPMIFCEKCAKGHKDNALIIHGTWGSGDGNWFPWLEKALAEEQISVAHPTLPDTKRPDYQQRMSFIEGKFSDYLNEGSTIIGHSSGAPTAIHLAEKHKLKRLILVAPVLKVDKSYKKTLAEAFDQQTADCMEKLVNRKINFQEVERNVDEIIVIFGERDPYLPKSFKTLAPKLFTKSKVIVLKNYAHFSDSTNDPKSFIEILNYLDVKNQQSESGMAGWNPVPEDQLPILLPDIKDFKPTGDGLSPLQKAPKSWLETVCPKCGGIAKRETDVSDTFLDSSWYFLAYPNLHTDEFNGSSFRASGASREIQRNDIKRPAAGGARSLDFARDDRRSPFNQELTKKWLPVNAYIGGAEHAVLHLLYSRFVWIALRDWGYLSQVSSEEPFPFLFSHGLIIKDGTKMSKSRGNVVNPDEYINRYGADALRMYLMFLGSYDQGGDFRDTGMAGMYRFLERVWRMFQKQVQSSLPADATHQALQAGKFKVQSSDREIQRLLNKTIKKVTEDIAKFKYNTAIAAMMEFINGWSCGAGSGSAREENERLNLSHDDAVKLIKLMAPFAPYISEEIWHRLYPDSSESIHLSSWPEYDPKTLEGELVEIPVQINGKTRAVICVEPSMSQRQPDVEKMAMADPSVLRYIDGKKINKIIFVSGKIINLIVN